MTTAYSSPPVIDSRWMVSPLPFAVWIAAQLGCLGIAFLHVPLAAKFPTGERVGVFILLAGQLAAASALSPILLTRWISTLVAAVSGLPFLLLAGALQAISVPNTLGAWSVVALWLALLCAWNQAAPGELGRRIISAAALLLSVGGTLLAYLVMELAVAADAESPVPAALNASPVLLAWRAAAGDSPSLPSVISPVGLLFLAILVRWTTFRRRARALSVPGTRQPS